MGNKENVKKKKLTSKKKTALELLHQILWHRNTIQLMAGDTSNVWEDIELIIDPEPFSTSFHISSKKKKARSKVH